MCGMKAQVNVLLIGVLFFSKTKIFSFVSASPGVLQNGSTSANDEPRRNGHTLIEQTPQTTILENGPIRGRGDTPVENSPTRGGGANTPLENGLAQERANAPFENEPTRGRADFPSSDSGSDVEGTPSYSRNGTRNVGIQAFLSERESSSDESSGDVNAMPSSAMYADLYGTDGSWEWARQLQSENRLNSFCSLYNLIVAYGVSYVNDACVITGDLNLGDADRSTTISADIVQYSRAPLNFVYFTKGVTEDSVSLVHKDLENENLFTLGELRNHIPLPTPLLDL